MPATRPIPRRGGTPSAAQAPRHRAAIAESSRRSSAARRAARGARRRRTAPRSANGGRRHRPAGGALRRTALHAAQGDHRHPARRARSRPSIGVPAVPIFWIEPRTTTGTRSQACGVLDADLTWRARAGRPAGRACDRRGAGAPGRLTRGASPSSTTLLPQTEFTPALLELCAQAYQPGAGMADAFGRWLESTCSAARAWWCSTARPGGQAARSPIFARELAHPVTTRDWRTAAGAALEARGYHAQVTPQDEAVALFHSTAAARRSGSAGRLHRRRRAETARSLLARGAPASRAVQPERAAASARAGHVFPTVCYVAGPERARLPRSAERRVRFGVPMPLIQQRATATILDSNAMRFLTRHELPFESLRAQDEAALNQLLEAQLPPPSRRRSRTRRDASTNGWAAGQAVAQVDPTLEGAARSTLARMQDDLKKLHAKVIQAAKRRTRRCVGSSPRPGPGVPRRPSAGARGRLRLLPEQVRPGARRPTGESCRSTWAALGD